MKSLSKSKYTNASGRQLKTGSNKPITFVLALAIAAVTNFSPSSASAGWWEEHMPWEVVAEKALEVTFNEEKCEKYMIMKIKGDVPKADLDKRGLECVKARKMEFKIDGAGGLDEVYGEPGTETGWDCKIPPESEDDGNETIDDEMKAFDGLAPSVASSESSLEGQWARNPDGSPKGNMRKLFESCLSREAKLVMNGIADVKHGYKLYKEKAKKAERWKTYLKEKARDAYRKAARKHRLNICLGDGYDTAMKKLSAVDGKDCKNTHKLADAKIPAKCKWAKLIASGETALDLPSALKPNKVKVLEKGADGKEVEKEKDITVTLNKHNKCELFADAVRKMTKVENFAFMASRASRLASKGLLGVDIGTPVIKLAGLFKAKVVSPVLDAMQERINGALDDATDEAFSNLDSEIDASKAAGKMSAAQATKAKKVKGSMSRIADAAKYRFAKEMKKKVDEEVSSLDEVAKSFDASGEPKPAKATALEKDAEDLEKDSGGLPAE